MLDFRLPVVHVACRATIPRVHWCSARVRSGHRPFERPTHPGSPQCCQTALLPRNSVNRTTRKFFNINIISVHAGVNMSELVNNKRFFPLHVRRGRGRRRSLSAIFTTPSPLYDDLLTKKKSVRAEREEMGIFSLFFYLFLT